MGKLMQQKLKHSSFLVTAVFIGLGLYSSTGGARIVTLETQRVDAAGVERVEMTGVAGSVELVSVAGAKRLELQVNWEPGSDKTGDESLQEDWDIKFETVDRVYRVSVVGPKNKEAWRKTAQKGVFPKYNLKLIGPSMPVSLNWRSLNLTAFNWMADIQAQGIDGVLQIRGGQGDLGLHLDTGRILVAQRKGSVEVESFNGEVELSGIVGNCQVTDFSGPGKVSGIKGDLTYKAMLGASNIAVSQGNIDFQNGRGVLNVSTQEGRVLGSTDTGNVKVTSVGKTDIRIKAKEGFVTIITPKGSGAQVNVGSGEGDLYVPSNFKVDRYPNLKVATGRLPGAIGGSVHVRSESGGIKVR